MDSNKLIFGNKGLTIQSEISTLQEVVGLKPQLIREGETVL